LRLDTMGTARDCMNTGRHHGAPPKVLLSGAGAFWRQVNGLLTAAFLMLLVVWPKAYAAVPLLAASTLIIGSLLTLLGQGAGRQRISVLDREDALWLLALCGFAGVWLADVARTGTWPEARANLGVWLPLWPVLAALMLLWLRCFPPSRLGWWLGLASGAIGAGGIALYERAWLGASRADNDINAIPFGDVSLLLGILSLVAMLGRVSRPAHYSRGLTGLLGVAAVAGLLASLLSGTRGGWIALPLLGWLIYCAFRCTLPARRLAWSIGMAGLLLAGTVVWPQTGVTSRVMQGVENVQRYFKQGEAGTSVGLRLDMWKAGLILFHDKPLAGWGEGRLENARDAMVQAGGLHPEVSRYDQLHSEIIDTAARRGLIGLIALGALYGIPLGLFSRHLRGSRDAQTRALALAGMIVPVAYIDFGLTQSLLRDAHGLAGYLGIGIICWALLKARQERRI
ncbi:MAG: O-antigen ligase family protein, partial [Halomonas sp.]|nr:O-antigen ligase family protein [Halomonas sp.]